jgi:hypothetical protein
MTNEMTHSEFSRRGGSSKSAAKIMATRHNAKIAREALRAIREGKKAQKSISA